MDTLVEQNAVEQNVVLKDPYLSMNQHNNNKNFKTPSGLFVGQLIHRCCWASNFCLQRFSARSSASVIPNWLCLSKTKIHVLLSDNETQAQWLVDMDSHTINVHLCRFFLRALASTRCFFHKI